MGMLYICYSSITIAATDNPHVALSVYVSGVVKTLYAKENKQYKKGAVLLTLDATLFDARINAAKQTLGYRELTLSEAEKEYQREQELYAQSLISESDLQKVKVIYLENKAAYQQAKEALITAQWEKQQTVLRAPFSGRIIKINTFVGDVLRHDFQVKPLLYYSLE